MRDRDQTQRLEPYLDLPTLTDAEKRLSALEGWILGCL